MGHCHCRNQRLLSSSRKALPHPKSRLDRHRRHLDAMVLYHKTPQFTVRFFPNFFLSLLPFHTPISCFPPPLPPLTPHEVFRISGPFFSLRMYPLPIFFTHDVQKYVHIYIKKKKKTSLAAVNFFLGCVGVTQVSRIFIHQRGQKATKGGGASQIPSSSAAGAGESLAKEIEAKAKGAVDTVKSVVKET